eukprot:Sspe_Gene.47535::Locus_24287_Transcript_1_1_Confidence_1.000_Length_1868::g.47535::m.47535
MPHTSTPRSAKPRGPPSRPTSPAPSKARTASPISARAKLGGLVGGQDSAVKALLEPITVALHHQRTVIEKQGELLVEHAHLIQGLQDEVRALREAKGGGHAVHLGEITSAALSRLTATVEGLQRDGARCESQILEIANKVGIELSTTTDPPVENPVEHPQPPPSPSLCNDEPGDTLHMGDDDTVECTGVMQHSHKRSHEREDRDQGHPPQLPSQRQQHDRHQKYRDLLAQLLDSDRTGDSEAPAEDTPTPTSTPAAAPTPTPSTSSHRPSRTHDLYDRGIVQMKRREQGIAEHRKLQEEEEAKALRSTPSISSLAKRSKSSEKSFSVRNDEWKQKREHRRQALLSELQRLEQEAMQPTPSLNARSRVLAKSKRNTSPPACSDRSVGTSSPSCSSSVARPSSPDDRSVSPLRPTSPAKPGHLCSFTSVSDSSSPPTHELLDRLRRRREMLGLEPPRSGSSTTL